MVDLGGVDIENSKTARDDDGDDEANLDDDLEKDNVEDDLGNDLEKEKNGENDLGDEILPASPCETELANSLCNFLINGLTVKFSCLVGSWPVRALASNTLLALTKHVIKYVEMCGFKIIRIVGDNAKINVKLFELLHTRKDEDEFKVTHPFDSNRILHLSYDHSHVFKNVRNQLVDRIFQINGKEICFSLIRLLSSYQRKHNMKLVRFLTAKHLNPTNMERMKVKPALDIFRPEMTAALELMGHYKIPGFENDQPLIEFLKFFWKWWEIHDISNTSLRRLCY